MRFRKKANQAPRLIWCTDEFLVNHAPVTH
jgi:hypothetical protein